MSKAQKSKIKIDRAVQSHWLTTRDGQDLYAESQGRGPLTLVFANGICCTDTYWKYMRAYFTPMFKLVVWDYRAHGRTPAPKSSAQMTVSQMADDMHIVVQALAPEGAVFVGHSMGGLVILEYASRYPAMVRGLVPICSTSTRPADSLALPALSPYIPRFLQLLRGNSQHLDVLIRRLAHPRLMYQFARRVGLIHPQLCSYSDMEPYFVHLARLQSAPILALFASLFEHDLSAALPKLKAPTLVIAGERDIMTPPELAFEMQKRITGSELLLVRGATHTALFEQPELIHLRLEKFIHQRVLV